MPVAFDPGSFTSEFQTSIDETIAYGPDSVDSLLATTESQALRDPALGKGIDVFLHIEKILSEITRVIDVQKRLETAKRKRHLERPPSISGTMADA